MFVAQFLELAGLFIPPTGDAGVVGLKVQTDATYAQHVVLPYCPADFKGLGVVLIGGPIIVFDLIRLHHLAEFLGDADVRPFHGLLQGGNTFAALLHQEWNIQRDRLFDPVNHSLHKWKDLTVDHVHLIHGYRDVLQGRVLAVCLRRHQTVVNLEAIDFFVDCPVLVHQRARALDNLVNSLL